jgi:prevent-host-death family protein
MNTIGIFEAKTKLSQICEHVHETKEPVLITKRGVPFVRIEPVNSRSQQPSAIWERRKAFIERYGEEFPDFELPMRETSLQYKNPLDE